VPIRKDSENLLLTLAFGRGIVARLNPRTIILALLIGPLPLFAGSLLHGNYFAELGDGNQVLWLTVSTNGPIRVIWGQINPITGQISLKARGQATDTNGKIIGTMRGPMRARGVLRAYARDSGRNGVTGTFRFISRDGESIRLRRFHARPR